MNGFEILSKLGEGAYSVVHKVRRREDGRIYALKKVKLLNLSDKEKLNALNEVRILASVKSPFVISYKEAFMDENDSILCIVMEYADKGDLYQKITQFKKMGVQFEEIDTWRIFIQMAKGLKALHDLKILHRDLKSANIFLFSDGTAKLGDLNVSKVAKKGLGYTQTGTPYYASPEVWKDEAYDLKSDVWSLGCVTYEMLSLRPPFRAENMEGLYNKVIKGQYSKVNDKYSSDMRELIRMLLQVSPEARPSCSQILNHSIIQKRLEFFKANITCSLDETEEAILLETIRIPKNLLFLTEKLPGSNYENKKKNNLMQNIQLKAKKNTSFPSVDLPNIAISSSSRMKIEANDKDNGNDNNNDSNNHQKEYNEENKDNYSERERVPTPPKKEKEIKKKKSIHKKDEEYNGKSTIQSKDNEELKSLPNVNKLYVTPSVKKSLNDYYSEIINQQKIEIKKSIQKQNKNSRDLYQIYCPSLDPQVYSSNRIMKQNSNIKGLLCPKNSLQKISEKKRVGMMHPPKAIIPNKKLIPLNKFHIK